VRRRYTRYNYYGHNKLVVTSSDLITSLFFKEKDGGIVGASLSEDNDVVYPLSHIIVEEGQKVYSLKYLRKNKLAEKMCSNSIVSETENFYILRED
jgi:hypothetical protein